MTYHIPKRFEVAIWDEDVPVHVHAVLDNHRGKQMVAFTLGQSNNKLVTLRYFVQQYLKHKLD